MTSAVERSFIFSSIHGASLRMSVLRIAYSSVLAQFACSICSRGSAISGTSPDSWRHRSRCDIRVIENPPPKWRSSCSSQAQVDRAFPPPLAYPHSPIPHQAGPGSLRNLHITPSALFYFSTCRLRLKAASTAHRRRSKRASSTPSPTTA